MGDEEFGGQQGAGNVTAGGMDDQALGIGRIQGNASAGGFKVKLTADENIVQAKISAGGTACHVRGGNLCQFHLAAGGGGMQGSGCFGIGQTDIAAGGLCLGV